MTNTTRRWDVHGPEGRDVVADEALGAPGGSGPSGVSEVQVRLVGGGVDVLAHGGDGPLRYEVTQLEGPPLRVSVDGGRVILDHTGFDPSAGAAGLLEGVKDLVAGGRRRARISLSVPAGVTASVSTVGADVLVGGLTAAVNVTTVSGSVRLSGLTGRVDVKTVSGALEGRDLRGDVVGKTVSGTTTLQDCAPSSVRLAGVDAPLLLDLVGTSCLITASTVAGDVTLRLPRGAGYDVRASSGSGHLVVDGHLLSGAGGERSGHRSEGDRAFAAKLRTVSGNVVVLHADDAPGEDVRSDDHHGDGVDHPHGVDEGVERPRDDAAGARYDGRSDGTEGGLS